MSLNDGPIFESLMHIPDVVPPNLWLPENSEVRIVKADTPSLTTTTPIEVGYCFYEQEAGGFPAEHQLLDLYNNGLEIPHNFLASSWGNHMGRIMLKAALDPDRYAPIDLSLAYQRESMFRGYNPSEEAFFMNFIQDWGVIKRRDGAI